MGTILVMVLAVLLVVLFVNTLLRRMPLARGSYEVIPVLLSPAENAFYQQLLRVVGKSWTICPKVRLADIIRTNGKGGYAAFNRIAAKHVDFLCVDPDIMAIFGVIELDDRSHELESRKNRDQFVNKALASAGVPICHIKVQREYNLKDLRSQISKAFRLM